jgi:hypothetical protein
VIIETRQSLVDALVELIPFGVPDLDLPLPPSDNRRLQPVGGRLVPTSEARRYLASYEWRVVLDQSGIPKPTASSPVLMVYQVTLKNHRRDSGNCLKILKDRIFRQDKHVFGWELPPKYATLPGVKIWFFSIPNTEEVPPCPKSS